MCFNSNYNKKHLFIRFKTNFYCLFPIKSNINQFVFFLKGNYYVNDISIVPNVSIVIFIYWTKKHFSMGLGCHKDQYEAFLKAFKEASGF